MVWFTDLKMVCFVYLKRGMYNFITIKSGINDYVYWNCSDSCKHRVSTGNKINLKINKFIMFFERTTLVI